MSTITIDQIATMSMIYSRYPFEYFLESTARLGFKQFELWSGYPQFYSIGGHDPKLSEIKQKVEEAGLKISCLTGEQAIYWHNLGTRDERIRKSSIDYFTTLIRQAAELGVDKYLMSIGWGYYDEPHEECWKRGIDAGAEVLKVAEQEKVNIVWEVMPCYTTSFINNLESAQRIVRELDSPYSRICVDTSAIAAVDEPLSIYFEGLGDKLYHIHLNDGSPDSSSLDGWLTWGDGRQDVDVHLETMSKYDYTGTISLELGDPSYMIDPEAAVRRGREHLLKHLPYTAAN